MIAADNVNWAQMIVTVLVAVIGSAGLGALVKYYRPSKIDRRAADLVDRKAEFDERREAVDQVLAAQGAELTTLRQLADAQKEHNDRMTARVDQCEAEKVVLLRAATDCDEHVARQARLIADQGLTIAEQTRRIQTQQSEIATLQDRVMTLETSRAPETKAEPA